MYKMFMIMNLTKNNINIKEYSNSIMDLNLTF